MKLKYVVPVAQMALAVGLLKRSDVWYAAVMRVSDSPGISPALRLLFAINAQSVAATVMVPLSAGFLGLPDIDSCGWLAVVLGDIEHRFLATAAGSLYVFPNTPPNRG